MTTLSSIKRFFTIAEASAYCGLSQQTIRKKLDSRELKKYQPTESGRPVLIDRVELDAMIESSGVPEPPPAA